MNTCRSVCNTILYYICAFLVKIINIKLLSMTFVLCARFSASLWVSYDWLLFSAVIISSGSTKGCNFQKSPLCYLGTTKKRKKIANSLRKLEHCICEFKSHFGYVFGCVLSCLGRYTETGWSLVQRMLPNIQHKYTISDVNSEIYRAEGHNPYRLKMKTNKK
jgi:hypothetical protein